MNKVQQIIEFYEEMNLNIKQNIIVVYKNRVKNDEDVNVILKNIKTHADD